MHITIYGYWSCSYCREYSFLAWVINLTEQVAMVCSISLCELLFITNNPMEALMHLSLILYLSLLAMLFKLMYYIPDLSCCSVFMTCNLIIVERALGVIVSRNLDVVLSLRCYFRMWILWIILWSLLQLDKLDGRISFLCMMMILSP